MLPYGRNGVVLFRFADYIQQVYKPGGRHAALLSGARLRLMQQKPPVIRRDFGKRDAALQLRRESLQPLVQFAAGQAARFHVANALGIVEEGLQERGRTAVRVQPCQKQQAIPGAIIRAGPGG